MDKNQVIQKLVLMRERLELSPKCKGRSLLIRKINNSIELLRTYKFDDGNIPTLIFKEHQKDFKGLSDSLLNDRQIF